MSSEPLRITFQNLDFASKHLHVARKEDYHKFIVYDAARYKKSAILDAMITACEPDVILPYMYEADKEGKISFVTRCSVNAMKKLVSLGLRLQLNPEVEIVFDIVLGFLTTAEVKYSPQYIISNVLFSRLSSSSKILDLDNFQKDEKLNSLYCPLQIPRVFEHILHMLRSRLKEQREARLAITKLSLRSNKLHHPLFNDKYLLPSLQVLDLRDNDLTDIAQLRHFADIKISEIWLDGNPLCNQYSTAEDYVKAVKTTFPHIALLDGVTVYSNKKIIPIIQPCYLANGSRTDLIKQFTEHFFTLYDQNDRIVLTGLYDDQALFSMTVGMLTSHVHKRQTQDWALNRNLLKFVDYSKCHEYLLRGSEKIISHLQQQPRTCHDLKHMNVDLLHFEDHHFVISVQGYFGFKDSIALPMYFSRTFVVVAKGESEYCIANDQYYIVSAGPNAKNLKFPKTLEFTPVGSLSSSEKQQLIVFVQSLSNMNEKYCKKFLDDAGWDIRLAIGNFMKAYTVNNILPEAYLSP